jgi:uncharacterized protein (DUF736 family)
MMSIIGKFVRQDDNSFVGDIVTLSMQEKAVRVVPAEKAHEKSPDYIITTSKGYQLGAGWKKEARDTGAFYISAKMDDPTFSAPIYATLMANDSGDYQMVWSR